jgi:hypothetical protein
MGVAGLMDANYASTLRLDFGFDENQFLIAGVDHVVLDTDLAEVGLTGHQLPSVMGVIT